MSLKDKVVVITGAGGVLCREFAIHAATLGAKVALLNRSEEKIVQLEQEIASFGGISKAYPVNVLDKEGLLRVKDHIHEEFGLVDILINGAGGNMVEANTSEEQYRKGDDIERSFFDLDIHTIDEVFRLNYSGSFLPTQVFALDMAQKEEGVILNVSSMASFSPMTKVVGYSGAKAAINNLTSFLAVHFAPSNIRVNAIAPGFFATKQNHSLLFTEEGNLTDRSKKIIGHTPMNRFGSPKDLLGAVNFLIDSELSSFVTGIVVPVDGGFMAYSGV